MKKNNNLIIYILSSLVIFAWVFNYAIQPALDKQNFEQKKLEFSKTLDTSIDNLANATISSSVSSQLNLDWVSIDILKNQYKSYISNWDREDAANILEQIYQISPSKEILDSLIENNLSRYDYKSALKYLEIYRKQYWLNWKTLIVYLNTLINNLTLNDNEKINNFIGVINDLYAQERINIEDYNLYKLIITYIKNDTSNYEYFLSQPYTGDSWLIASLRENKTSVQSYRDPPVYYRKALDAASFFSYGYIPMAMEKAFEINKQAPEYLLPKQIIAYWYFLQEKWPESISWLEKLSTQDYENVRSYQYLLWVASYWNENYSSSIKYLTQLADSDEKFRYMLLAKYKNWDKTFLENAKKIENLNEYDYYTIFNLAFEKNETFYLNQDLIYELLEKCPKDISKSYICDYGLAKYFYTTWEKQKAISYFEKIVDIYKNPAIAYLLAQYYEPTDKKLAKKYYLKVALYSTSSLAKDQAKEKVSNLR